MYFVLYLVFLGAHLIGLDQLFFFSTYYSVLQFSTLLPIILIERNIIFLYHPLFSNPDDEILTFTFLKSKIDTKLTARFHHNKLSPIELESY